MDVGLGDKGRRERDRKREVHRDACDEMYQYEMY
jgi:hypothetical protein